MAIGRWLVAVALALAAPAAADCPRHTRFDVLDDTARATRATAAAAWFPTDWNAHAEVDEVGMPSAVDLELDGTRSGSELALLLLAVVRAHACELGAIDPAQLAVIAQERWVVIVQRPTGVGAVRARLDRRRGKHVRVEVVGQRRPPFSPGNDFVEDHTLSARDLDVVSGPAIVFGKRFAEVRAAVRVDLASSLREHVAAAGYPMLWDARTARPICEPWLSPPIVAASDDDVPDDVRGTACAL